MGQIFLNSLKMIVVPLIMSSLIYNISSFSSTNDLSNLGIKTIVFYLVTSFSAVIIGITVVNIVQPGLINGVGAANIVGLSTDYNISEFVNSQDSYSLNSFFA
jgi:Na+/H+-dicarboxylate symporter